jgi:hypothetical protein
MQVVDPYSAVNNINDYYNGYYLILQTALREATAILTADDILSKRNEIGLKVLDIASQQFENIGLKLISVSIKDIMFPGELKKKFADIALAKKEGQAALERARGESAALRNLTNAAKMIENNPYLGQLRIIQVMSESKGNTYVLGIPPSIMPVKNETELSTGEKGNNENYLGKGSQD